MKRYLGRVLLEYLRFLSKIQLLKYKPRIIGITGSAGKTSTRDAIYSILKNKYRCKVSEKGNSESGIPLDILGLQMRDYTILDWIRVFLLAPIQLLINWKKHDVYIVEMGVDSPFPPKNMGYLLRILRPDVGVFINALPVHSEPFDELVRTENKEQRYEQIIKLIAQEKGKMIKALTADGFAVLNFNDLNVKSCANTIDAKVISVGISGTDIQYSNYEMTLDGFGCEFKYDNKVKKLYIPDMILSSSYCVTFALAIGVGLAMGINFTSCVKSLEKYKLPCGRMTLIKGIKNSLIIDSSYNASTQPVLDSLDVLGILDRSRKKIAVLGDMRELGQEAELEYKKIADRVAKIADEIVLIGPLMKKYFIPIIVKKGFNQNKLHHFDNTRQAIGYVKKMIKGDELILIKGSQNTLFLEIIVENIMLHPEDANKLLCRRGVYWDVKRAEI